MSEQQSTWRRVGTTITIEMTGTRKAPKYYTVVQKRWSTEYWISDNRWEWLKHQYWKVRYKIHRFKNRNTRYQF